MHFSRIGILVGIASLVVAGTLAQAQTSQPESVGFSNDSTQPLELTADSLRLDPDAGTAVFDGSVQVSQGKFRLQADRVEVFYSSRENSGAKDIDRLVATGNVKLVSGSEKAEARSAIYDVADGNIRMQGDVLLTQGNNLLAGDTAIIDLEDGSARVEGNVRTVLAPDEAAE